MSALIRLLPLAALVLAPPLAAKPADYAPVVAAKSRSAEARKLDEGRMPAAILDFAGFERGDVVADYQAGSGYYSELIAGVVGPRGRVIAINQTNFHDAKEWAPLLAAHPNVVPLVAAGDRHQLARAASTRSSRTSITTSIGCRRSTSTPQSMCRASSPTGSPR